MAKLLAIATHATDDPTKCSLAFVTALGAIGGGHTARVALLGEAVYITKPEVAKGIHGVGFPPLTELISKALEAGVEVFS